MLGVTGFGLIFTPTFYVVCRALGDRMDAMRQTRGRSRAARRGTLDDGHAVPAE
jgi:hypothetical protein